MTVSEGRWAVVTRHGLWGDHSTQHETYPTREEAWAAATAWNREHVNHRHGGPQPRSIERVTGQ